MGSVPPSVVLSARRRRGQVIPNRERQLIIAEFQAKAFKAIDDSMKPNATIELPVPSRRMNQPSPFKAIDDHIDTKPKAVTLENPVSARPPNFLCEKFGPSSELMQLFSTKQANLIGPPPEPVHVQSTPDKNVQNRFKKWRKADSDSESHLVQEVNFDSQVSSAPPVQYFNIQLAKMSTKKHKTWEDDGVMIVDGKKVTITVGDSTKSSNKFKLPKELVPGETQFQWEGKLVLIQDQMSSSEVDVYKDVQSNAKFNQNLSVDQPKAAKEDMEPEETIMEVEPSSKSEPTVSSCYSILLAKRTTKKHKTWGEDGEMRIDRVSKKVTITVGETSKFSTTLKLKLPKDIIPGETEFVWEGKLVLVRLPELIVTAEFKAGI